MAEGRNCWSVAKASGLWLALALAVPVSVSAGQNGSVPPPDPTEGLIIAERWCAQCHIVSSDQALSTETPAPTFRSIANRPEQTAAAIVGFLVDPHPPMPDLNLTRQEMDHIVAYLSSLRSPDAGPALTLPTPKTKKKIQYPESG